MTANSRYLAIALLLVGFVVPATYASAAERVALVLGNGAYTDTSTLQNAPNDARDMATVLRNVGFDVVVGTDLTRQEMTSKLREFSRKLVGARVGLFFYSGHGIQRDGQNYLMPIDAKLEQEADLFLDTIEVDLVLRQMESDSRVSLVFLDACRNNPLAGRYAARLSPTRSASVGRGLAPIKATASGTMIAFSTEPGNVASDGAGRNSPFTAALLKHIRTPGLDISILMRHVRNDVREATSRQQTPWEHSSLTESVVFTAGSPSQAPLSKASAPAFRTTPAIPIHDSTGIYWPWTKFCDRRDAQAREACRTFKEVRNESGQFLASAMLIEPQGEDRKLLRVTFPANTQGSVAVQIDNEPAMQRPFGACQTSGCIAEFDAGADFIAKLKRGTNLKIWGGNPQGQVSHYVLYLTNFADANEGLPSDPRRFEADQKNFVEALRNPSGKR